MKRMIQNNLGPGGTLNTDRLSRALLTYSLYDSLS